MSEGDLHSLLLLETQRDRVRWMPRSSWAQNFFILDQTSGEEGLAAGRHGRDGWQGSEWVQVQDGYRIKMGAGP